MHAVVAPRIPLRSWTRALQFASMGNATIAAVRITSATIGHGRERCVGAEIASGLGA